MTERYNALTVILENDIREDDAQALVAAIRQLRGVLNVTGEVCDSLASVIARERARRDLGDKLWRVIYPDDKA